MTKKRVCVVVLNWNGEPYIADCLRSLEKQTVPCHIIVVDNASHDDSVPIIQKQFPGIELICNAQNLGFARGVNTGIRPALAAGYDYVALLNNDATAHPGWVKGLLEFLDKNPSYGIVTRKLLTSDGKRFDGTGEVYTIWGIHYPRGRGEVNSDVYDNQVDIFGGSGGASMYRTAMLEQIGLFDEDFFMYYEDVDLSFRAQLAGWKAAFVPKAKVYHRIGASSKQVKGLTTYQTLRNLPFVLLKNAPVRLLRRILPRLILVYSLFFLSAWQRKQGKFAVGGVLAMLGLLPKKLWQRHRVQQLRTVSVAYLTSIIEPDLPPTADRLRALRSKWWKLTGRRRTT